MIDLYTLCRQGCRVVAVWSAVVALVVATEGPLATGYADALSAHNDVAPLLLAVPPSGAILRQAPTGVALTFAGRLDPLRSYIVVLGESMQIANAAAVVGGARHNLLMARLYGGLHPGPYAVAWSAAFLGSATVQRSYLFTIAPVGPPLLPDHRVRMRRSGGGLTVTLNVPSDRVTHQTYTVTLSAGRSPVSDAQVTVSGRALDMEMGESPAVIVATGGGRYQAVGDVTMAGGWQVTVTVRWRHRTRQVTFTYTAHY